VVGLIGLYGPWSRRRGGIVPHMLKTLVFLLCIGALGGCITAPSVQVRGDARIEQRSEVASAGTVAVRITNPNARSIRLVEYDYSVAVQGGSSWRGRHDGGLVLSPGFDRVADLPIVLPAGIAPGTRIHIGGSLHYLDTSTFAQTMADWGYRPTAGFSGSAVIAGPAQEGPPAP